MNGWVLAGLAWIGLSVVAAAAWSWLRRRELVRVVPREDWRR